MKSILKAILVSVIFIFMLMPVYVFADGISFEDMPKVTNVVSEKEWTVKFSLPLKAETVNSDNIKVYKGDYPGSAVPVSVSIRPGTNANEIIVGSPASGYVPGRTYSLIIGKDVQAISGAVLTNPVKMLFQVEDIFDNGSSDGNYPNITNLNFGYTPLTDEQKQDFYITASGGSVQYRIFVHDYEDAYDNYEELTNGYTGAVNGSAASKVTALKGLDSGTNGKKYKVIVYVKRANTAGAHKTNIAGIKDMDYDNYYVDYFRVVPSKVSLSGNKSIAYSLQQEVAKQLTVSPKTDEGDGSYAWVNPNSNMIKYYLNPDNFMDNYGKNLFLRLDSYVDDISVDSINNLLKGAGVLEGNGQAFLDAAKKYDINPAYFVSHTLHETGNGTSQLSKGVVVQGKTVYNFFGIKAVDSDPVGAGSKYAYSEGWFTPEAAIMGGAEYIATNYIKNPVTNQNTLYKMRWNQENPGTHQYASDIAWQIIILKNMNALLSNSKASLRYEVPVFLK